MKEYIEKSKAVERALYTPIMSSGAVREEDRDAWIDGTTDAQEQVAKSIGEIPAADVVERKRGEWVEIKAKNFYGCMITTYECTSCKKHSVGQVAITMKSDFCPNCGADMRGENNA